MLDILEGKRPEITEDTPEFYANLMKKCWDLNPENRPTAKEIRECIDKYRTPLGYEIIKLAESKRKEIIKSQKYLTNEKSHKNHQKSFYTIIIMLYKYLMLSKEKKVYSNIHISLYFVFINNQERSF